MARSFSRATERSAAVYEHRPSDTVFAMVEHDGRSFQQQYQIGPDTRQNTLTEKRVDFVLGSGNHARAFLHQTPRGELIELPLGWYSENGGTWAMNPGYDRPDHEGFRRRIGYDCMFCHNAYPEIPADSGPRSPPVYISLPEGIDCQRCHGSGELHIALAGRRAPSEEIRAAIVNPARLSPQRRMEVCLQCHLETTSSALPNAIVRFERGPFSFQPGEALSDFILHFDRAQPDDRVEINSSAYRLRQSKCFLQSAGRMTCTTCHNPHEDSKSRDYSAKCRQCHLQTHASAAEDCVGCHMPKRRTDDVVHAAITDHFIQRRAPARDLLAAKAEPPPQQYRGEVVPYYPSNAGELYTAIAQVSQGSNLKAGIARLTAALEKARPARAEYYLQLGDALRMDAKPADAVRAYQEAVRWEPGSAAALERLALALSDSKQFAQAEAVLKQAMVRSPNDAALWARLGGVYVSQGRVPESIVVFEKATRLDPDMAEAYNSLGAVLPDAGRAEAAFRTAIRLRPNYAEAHQNLANRLASAGRFEEARPQFEAAIHINPAARYDYALALSKLRRFDEAQAQLESILRADGTDFDARALLGNVFGAKGQLEQAIGQFREAVRIRPDSARANLDLGAALADTGDRAAARSYLQKAVESSDQAIREDALAILRRF
jgi:tetratricopeptide (TPR) repeat protein